MHAIFAMLAAVLTPVGAIVLITLAVRAALHPLTRSAVRGEKARLRLAPKLAEIRRKHAKDPTKAAEATLALHKAEGISPFAGLLPLLVQIPVFFLLYRLVSGEGGGTFLGQHLFSGAAPWFALLLAGLTVVAWFTARRSTMLMQYSPVTAQPGVLARLPRILPYTTVVAAAFVPMALAVYLLTTTTWTLVENIVLRRGLPG
jgi:YidC/Oxa1 family membrane protein insertase